MIKKDQKIRKKQKHLKKIKRISITKSAVQKKDQKDQKNDQLQKREFPKDQLVWSFGKRTYSKRSTSLIFRGTSLLQKINWLDLLVCPCRHHVQHPRLPGPPPEPSTATFPLREHRSACLSSIMPGSARQHPAKKNSIRRNSNMEKSESQTSAMLDLAT